MEKIPPHNEEAEQMFLSALIDNYKVAENTQLQTSDFYLEKHQIIFKACKKLQIKNKEYDIISLTDFLDKQKELEKIGGRTYLAELLQGVCLNPSSQEQIIKQKSNLRKVLEYGQKLIDGSYDEDEEKLSKLFSDFTLDEFKKENDEIKLISDIAENSFPLYEKYATKIPMIDEAFGGGFKNGDLVVVSGMTSHGKTTMCQDITYQFANQSLPVLWFSYEVLLPYLWQKFKNMGVNKDFLAYAPLKNITGRLDWVEKKIKEAKEKFMVKLVVIDHLGFLAPKFNEKDISQNYSAYLGQICRELKHIAINEEVIILLPVHLRKTNDPQINDIKDCLDQDQLILTTSGVRKPIKNIKKGNKVFSYRSMNSLQNDKVKNCWNSGIKKIYELTTKTGRRIKCSDGHKFYALTYKKAKKFGANQGAGVQGWTKLKDLKIGQKIAVVKKYPEINYKDTLFEEQALLLGWIIGDGNITRNFYSTLTLTTEEEINKIKDISYKAFNLFPTIVKYKDKNAYNVFLTTDGRRIKRKRNNLRWFLKSIKLNAVSKNKYIPEIIFTQSNKIISNFLSGLFHADGCIYEKKRWGKSVAIKLTTISENIAYSIQHLLLRFGIISYVKIEVKNIGGFRTKTTKIYNISLYGNDVINFVNNIGFQCEKQKKALKMIVNFKPKRINKKSDMFFDKITSIEYLYEKETYDIEVRGKHASLINNSFCVQDFVTHNSVSVGQESDIVIILNRLVNEDENITDYYSPVTEITIAKNREFGRTSKGFFELQDGLFKQIYGFKKIKRRF